MNRKIKCKTNENEKIEGNDRMWRKMRKNVDYKNACKWQSEEINDGNRQRNMWRKSKSVSLKCDRPMDASGQKQAKKRSVKECKDDGSRARFSIKLASDDSKRENRSASLIRKYKNKSKRLGMQMLERVAPICTHTRYRTRIVILDVTEIKVGALD